jgi:hypothetical protein
MPLDMHCKGGKVEHVVELMKQINHYYLTYIFQSEMMTIRNSRAFPSYDNYLP